MRSITDTAIRAALRRAQDTGRPVSLRDPGPRGGGRLALQVRPGSVRPTAEWYAVYYRQGRRQQAKLGTYPAMPLQAAREVYRREFEPAIAAGRDPRAARQEAAHRRRQAGTVEALFRAYVDHLRALGRRSWREYENALLRLSYNAADALGRDRLAADVLPADVAAHLGAIYRRGARSHADHVRSYMHAAFEWGLRADHDYRQHGAAGVRWGLTSNPVSAIPRDTAAAVAGDRHLSPDELAAFWRWLEGRQGNASAVLRLQIATGQRVQMLAGLRAGQYVAAERLLEWAPGDTKNRTPHVLPLPRVAWELLDQMRPNREGMFFPQPNAPARAVTHFTVADLCREYCAAAGVASFTPRDVRRTWKTLTGLAGIGKDIRDRLQHHALHDVGSKNYDRYGYLAEKRAGMARWSAWLDRLLGAEPQVVPFVGTSPRNIAQQRGPPLPSVLPTV